MTDAYQLIHQLLKEHRYDQVIDLLYVSASLRLNKIYESDANHGWYILGDIYFKRKELSKSLYFFKKALLEWSGDSDCVLAISNIYSLQDCPQKAVDFLEPYLDALGDDRLIYNYASALFDLGRYEDSLVFYRKIPKDVEIYHLARANVKKAKLKINQHKA